MTIGTLCQDATGRTSRGVSKAAAASAAKKHGPTGTRISPLRYKVHAVSPGTSTAHPQAPIVAVIAVVLVVVSIVPIYVAERVAGGDKSDRR